VIRERELELAIAAANIAHVGGDAHAFVDAAIDLRAATSYAKRYAQVSEVAEKSYRDAAAGGFLLGFELGVRAARVERKAR
jgi:hypothetical protein